MAKIIVAPKFFKKAIDKAALIKAAAILKATLGTIQLESECM